MRLRRRALPLLIVLPSLANCIALGTRDDDADINHIAREAAGADYPAISRMHVINTPKADVGTKDAPVDGKDGKPHDGPWVDGAQRPTEDDNPLSGDRLDPLGSYDKAKGDAAGGSRKVSEPHDGVMDDPNRASPKKGTTGTEGGISEKSKDRKESGTDGDEKSPESPKNALPVLDSVTGDKLSADEKPIGAAGLEKPEDLPDTPYDAPRVPPPVVSNDGLPDAFPRPDTTLDDGIGGEGANVGVIEEFHSYVLSFAMILFAEVGDKTFLLACLMAMRHPQLLVFSAAFSALITMTILSALLGHAVPTLLSKQATSLLAAGLFFFFGFRLLQEGYHMDPNEGVGEEMKEVEMELEEKEHKALKARRGSSVSPYALEAGRGRHGRLDPKLTPPHSASPSLSRSSSPNRASFANALSGLENLLSLLLSPAWVQTFIMTFLGEFGDRSQVATIAMAAGDDYWWVVWGAISGHAVCTGAAVIGGRAIAGRVSMRKVTLGGGCAFFVFGVIYLVEGLFFL